MQTIKTLLVFSLIIGILVFQPGCKKDKSPDDDIKEQPGHIPGMGNNKNAPEGALFQLPKGVSLVGAIKGYDLYPTTQDACVMDGTGRHVMVKMTLQNDSIGAPRTVEFPPGLVIVSTSEGFQSGLLVEKVVVELPPRQPGPGAPPKCIVRLMLSCVNQSLNPSEDFATYKLGPVTSSPLIKDLIKKLSGKKLRYSQYADKDQWEDVEEIVQKAVYALTEHGEGIDDRLMEKINKLPNK